MASRLKNYHGGVDGYARDAMKFHRLCYLRDSDINLADIKAAYDALLVKSVGTRFEVWTHERMAQEYATRGLKKEARATAKLALDLATGGYPAPIAKIVLATLK